MRELMINMIQHYGYAAVLISMVVGIIGLPIPIDFMLLFAGSIVLETKLNLLWLIFYSWIGCTVGMTVNYLLGKYIGIQRISRITRYIHLSEAQLNGWGTKFKQLGLWIIPIGFFVAGLRHVSPFIAGASRMAFPKFIGMTLAGGLFWISVFAFAGQRLGRHWHTLLKLLHSPLVIIGMLVIVGFVLALKARWVKIKPFRNNRVS
ncbi:DedA family protein [Paenibacillus filicis]|uniref:DedA family protein n=1 Tax=Paenibacillus gyeongsangnamensis TaxID=3388067 RepID=A0ABT4Q5U9_9BACL|nr:DedA family protein [Paenibacillus filicis]MCZ8512237.1 DedA family protein [Paenibacillus filicis]